MARRPLTSPSPSATPAALVGRPDLAQDPPEDLGALSVRELLQRLVVCEEALRITSTGVSTSVSADVSAAQLTELKTERRRFLETEVAVARELRRRRHLGGQTAERDRGAQGSERRRSAAWPPPPW